MKLRFGKFQITLDWSFGMTDAGYIFWFPLSFGIGNNGIGIYLLLFYIGMSYGELTEDKE